MILFPCHAIYPPSKSPRTSRHPCADKFRILQPCRRPSRPRRHRHPRVLTGLCHWPCLSSNAPRKCFHPPKSIFPCLRARLNRYSTDHYRWHHFPIQNYHDILSSLRHSSPHYTCTGPTSPGFPIELFATYSYFHKLTGIKITGRY